MSNTFKEYSEAIKKSRKLRLKLLIMQVISELQPTRGAKGLTGAKGEPGTPGIDGKTPVKGLDYMTAGEIVQIKEELTPKKGKDYFTPEEVKSVIAIVTERISKSLPDQNKFIEDVREEMKKAVSSLPKNMSEEEIVKIVYRLVSNIVVPIPSWSKISGNPVDSAELVDYIDTRVVGLLKDRGNYDASGNVFPSTGGSGTAGAVKKGDLWLISVAGTLGGQAVQLGDSVRALVNTPGQTASNWAIMETNLSYTPENTTNKSTNVTTDGASDTKYPSVKAVKDYADTLVSTAFAIENRFRYFNDFVSGLGEFSTNNAGTGATTSMILVSGEANHPGIAKLGTGSTNSGRATVQYYVASLLLGGGIATFKSILRIPTLSDSAETFEARIGFGDNAGADFVDGVYFKYSSTINSGKFQLVTADTSVRTTADSGVTVASATWYNLKVVVNANASSAEFFINGTSVGTITTNIPKTAGRELGAMCVIQKTGGSVGTTDRSLEVDVCGTDIIFTTPR